MYENGNMDHYFPQWLMRNWCDTNNEIWCFDKRASKIKKKGTSFFAREQDLNKSDIVKLDLESSLFNRLDNKHSRLTDALLLQSYYKDHRCIPDDVMQFFIELCLWTSIRNRRVQDWTDIDEFRAESPSDHVLQTLTDAELKKAVHLQFCKLCDERVMEEHVKRLSQDFYCFFAVSQNKFITSDLPVQEFGTELAENVLECEPINDHQCSVILFPLYPSVMFVATRHKEYAQHHRQFLSDELLTEANYILHLNSDSDELFFPYPIYDPKRLPAVDLAPAIRNRIKDNPCALDLNQYEEQSIASIIHSNWTGSPKKEVTIGLKQ